jgi:hypothetical protein
MRVCDGERIATLAVAGGEVTLEIHAPKLIRTGDRATYFGDTPTRNPAVHNAIGLDDTG